MHIVEKNAKKIYSYLGDEESKDVFRCRLSYSLLADEKALLPIMDGFKEKVFSDERYVQLKETVSRCGDGAYIFGTGSYARMLLKVCERVRWKGFVVSSLVKDSFETYPVMGLDELEKRYEGEYVFLPSKAYYGEMRERLISIGVPSDQIVDATVLFDITEGRQYFDLPYLKYRSDEVFVDCGCYDGTSAIGFLNSCNGDYKHIYAFEPDKGNLKKIENFYRNQGIDKYTLINKGVWDMDEELAFAANGSANSHIQGIIDKNESRIETIEVTALDKCLGNVDISFIKMDIEGAEYKALCGAKDIIKRCRPKLAICVYHKPEDIWEIPELIMDIRDDYKLYLRHYSFRDTETVLYAV